MKYCITAFLILFSLSASFAQKETYNWSIAENIGITFNPNGVNPKPIMINSYGSRRHAIISDSEGKILFYFDGNYVYNKKFEIMPNSNILYPSTDYNACFAHKKPGSDNEYYLFYEQDENNHHKFACAVIDIDLDGGLGDIKEIKILEENALLLKLTPVNRPDSDNYWLFCLIRYDSNQSSSYSYDSLCIYNVTKNSISYSHSINGEFASPKHWGYWIINNDIVSLDGNKYATLLGEDMDKKIAKIAIYDLNPETAEMELKKEYKIHDAVELLDFSPDGNKLWFFINNNCITQIDMNVTPDELSLGDTEVIMIPPEFSKYLEFHYNLMGPDGQLYFHLSTGQVLTENGYVKPYYLGCIDKPNFDISECKLDTINIGSTKVGNYSYPRFLNSDYHVSIDAGDTIKICEGEDLLLSGQLSRPIGDMRYSWTGPDYFESEKASPVRKNCITSFSGWYHVNATNDNFTVGDSVYVIVGKQPTAKIDNGGDNAFCEGDSLKLTAYSIPDDPDNSYLWSTGEKTKEIYAKESGKYTVEITNNQGCSDEYSVSLAVYPAPEPEILIIGDNDKCEGEEIELKVNGNYDSYKWSTGETSAAIKVNKSGIYYVSVISSQGCEGVSDEVEINFLPLPEIKISGPREVCVSEGNIYTIDNSDNCLVEWTCNFGNITSDSDKDNVATDWPQKGLGELIATKTNPVTGCAASDTLYVEIADSLHPKIIGSDIICEDGPGITLKTEQEYDTYLWSTGETVREIIVDKAGDYSVRVSGASGCDGTSDIFRITESPKPQPEVTGNIPFCEGGQIEIKLEKVYEDYLWSTGETTPSILMDDSGNFWVEVTNSSGCKGRTEFTTKKTLISVEGLSDYNFPSADIGLSDRKTVNITNTGDTEIVVGSISLKGLSGNVFTLEGNEPGAIASGAGLDFDIVFSPDLEQEYTDSVYIYVSSPCERKYSAEISGTGKAVNNEIIVSIPDLKGKPGTDNFEIPVYARTKNENTVITDINYECTISYDASMFLPLTISGADELSNSIEGYDRIIRFSGSQGKLSNENTILAKISGKLLLFNTMNNVVNIDAVNFFPTATVTRQPGSLTIEEYCAPDLRGVVFSAPPLTISPNPANARATISINSTNINNTILGIYDLLGNCIKNIDIETNGDYILNLTDFPSGIYMLLLKTGTDIYSQRLIVE